LFVQLSAYLQANERKTQSSPAFESGFGDSARDPRRELIASGSNLRNDRKSELRRERFQESDREISAMLRDSEINNNKQRKPGLNPSPAVDNPHFSDFKKHPIIKQGIREQYEAKQGAFRLVKTINKPVCHRP
jgi:hypothetical protein